MSKRHFASLLALLLLGLTFNIAYAQGIQIDVAKTPTCGCCTA